MQLNGNFTSHLTSKLQLHLWEPNHETEGKGKGKGKKVVTQRLCTCVSYETSLLTWTDEKE